MGKAVKKRDKIDEERDIDDKTENVTENSKM
jgi:hypothetical protein